MLCLILRGLALVWAPMCRARRVAYASSYVPTPPGPRSYNIFSHFSFSTRSTRNFLFFSLFFISLLLLLGWACVTWACNFPIGFSSLGWRLPPTHPPTPSRRTGMASGLLRLVPANSGLEQGFWWIKFVNLKNVRNLMLIYDQVSHGWLTLTFIKWSSVRILLAALFQFISAALCKGKPNCHVSKNNS